MESFIPKSLDISLDTFLDFCMKMRAALGKGKGFNLAGQIRCALIMCGILLMQDAFYFLENEPSYIHCPDSKFSTFPTFQKGRRVWITGKGKKKKKEIFG